MHIRIATRKSQLAVWQAEHVASRLEALDEVDSVELVRLSTKGDEILDRSLQKIGGKGLFIKELEVAMHEDRADLAVHSMKDVPAEMPEGFCIAAILERASDADALVSGGISFDELKNKAVVGSSSLRRQAQLRMLRPDLDIRPLRGNVNTRLAKLDAGEFDAIILAAAGLERLAMHDRITARFTPEQMLPAASQGVIGIECLEEREQLRQVLAQLDHEATVQTTLAEREIARYLDASCQSPVAAHATISSGELQVTGLAALPDGSEHVRETASGSPADAAAVGRAVAVALRERGVDELLDRARRMTE
ncbi:MAG: hydroxymethylbilane synthase [Pseudomonadota bacterium]